MVNKFNQIKHRSFSLSVRPTTLIPNYSNSMHIPWLVIGHSPAVVNIVKNAVSTKQIDPSDVTFFVGDIASQEVFSEDTFRQHATGISPKCYSHIGFKAPHQLNGVRPNFKLTNVSLNDHAVFFWDSNNQVDSPNDQKYTFEKLIACPQLSDKYAR